MKEKISFKIFLVFLSNFTFYREPAGSESSQLDPVFQYMMLVHQIPSTSIPSTIQYSNPVHYVSTPDIQSIPITIQYSTVHYSTVIQFNMLVHQKPVPQYIVHYNIVIQYIMLVHQIPGTSIPSTVLVYYSKVFKFIKIVHQIPSTSIPRIIQCRIVKYST